MNYLLLWPVHKFIDAHMPSLSLCVWWVDASRIHEATLSSWIFVSDLNHDEVMRKSKVTLTCCCLMPFCMEWMDGWMDIYNIKGDTIMEKESPTIKSHLKWASKSRLIYLQSNLFHSVLHKFTVFQSWRSLLTAE